MEPEVDISDIMLTPEEQAAHFIDLKEEKKKPDIYHSSKYPSIFYAKRGMRQLLEERTRLCLQLGLSSKNGKSSNIDKESMQVFFGQLFKDCPNLLAQYSWTIVQDRGTVYGFLASEDKYVPLCKNCSKTVYVSLRGVQGRIVCGNPTCKVKLLGQYEIGPRNRVAKSSSFHNHKSSRTIHKSELLQQKNQQIMMNLQDRMMIKKAARKIAN